MIKVFMWHIIVLIISGDYMRKTWPYKIMYALYKYA